MPSDDTPLPSSGSEKEFSFFVQETDSGKRLDQFLTRALKNSGEAVSRNAVQGWIKTSAVSVNGKTASKPRHEIAVGDEIALTIPEKVPTELLPEDIPLTVLFEDEHIIVIDKPSGLVVHPGSGNPNGTLVNALLHHCDGKLSQIGDKDRPGIVHRLDKDTSGCLVAAKSDQAHQALVSQFSGRTTTKEYIAVVNGIPGAPEGRIENRLGRHPVHRQRMTVLSPPAGKEAITEYLVEKSNERKGWTLIHCRILTGRTHQIRVHMKESLRCPILGDPIYGKPSRDAAEPVSRLMLHAERLTISHPLDGKELTFRSDMPEEFKKFSW